MKYTIYSPDRTPITEVELGEEVERARFHDGIAVNLGRVINRFMPGTSGAWFFMPICLTKEKMPDDSTGLIAYDSDVTMIRCALAQ